MAAVDVGSSVQNNSPIGKCIKAFIMLLPVVVDGGCVVGAAVVVMSWSLNLTSPMCTHWNEVEKSIA